MPEHLQQPSEAEQNQEQAGPQRQRAEELLPLERFLFETLMDNIPDSIYFKDRASRFTRINKALAQRFGLQDDPSQAVGRTDFDFFAEEHARQAYADEQAVIRTGQPIVGKEEKETWPDGGETWVSTTKMPLVDNDGCIVGTFGMSRDISERKRAEAAHQQLNEELMHRVMELQQALDQIKHLQGLLPICAWCKKVRDDQAYWHKVEDYLTAHSEVRFSHSICPECLQQHFENATCNKLE
jgi:PAS domain S-box-containing protein